VERLSLNKTGGCAPSSIFTVSDADGDPITLYQFLDATTTADSSYFWVNGTTPPSSFADPITVSAADLANVWLHGGATIGVVDALQVRAFDSPTSASAWATINLTTQAPNSGPNIFRGGPAHDVLSGTPGDDTFFGDDGNDVITGGFGNDTINGNDGFDIATYSGSKASYTITPNLGTFAVTGPDGNDTVSNVEKLTFGDGSVKLLSSIAHASGNDLTGDGVGDILWRNDNGTAAVWGLNGTAVTGGAMLNGGTVIGTDWNIAGVTDFNGDGRSDILWRNDDGRVAEWNMNGTTIVGGGFVNGGAAGDAQLADCGRRRFRRRSQKRHSVARLRRHCWSMADGRAEHHRRRVRQWRSYVVARLAHCGRWRFQW
jgi:hypothetical protein